jgi:hypothetical protein
MHQLKLARLAAVITACAYLAFASSQAATQHGRHGPPAATPDEAIQGFSQSLLAQGQQTFRYDTFGDEDYWGGELRLHEAIEGSMFGGVGPGVSPKTALAVGLKVDVDALPRSLQNQLEAGTVNLDDPATTLALLKLNAVVGITGRFNDDGSLKTMGIQCALCHSTVDNALAPGIGHRLDGWANRDLNVGAIIALAPNLQGLATLLGTSVATVKTVLNSWGPGKFDAALILDGKAFRPDGSSAATLIPPVYGLGGVNLHTWTGWGSIPHWNAFVAVLEMHGKGTFFDPRLDDAGQFPIAARERFGHVTNDPDLVSSKLPALQYYQLSIPAPAPPPGSFDEAAAERGDGLFSGRAKCASCHLDGYGTEPGWNMHKAEDIGIDDFQANRAPDRAYRTSPLKGLWAHMKGGFYHDGRFATLMDVMNHYDGFFHLGLSDGEKRDVVEYLKSLSDDVPPSNLHRGVMTASLEAAGASAEPMAARGGLSVWPLPAVSGQAVHIAFVIPSQVASAPPADLRVEVYDVAGRRIGLVPAASAPAEHGLVTVTWDGKIEGGSAALPGVYMLRAEAPSIGLYSVRRIVVH